MRRAISERLVWLVVGFVFGCVGTVLFAALNLWSFQENILLHWVRWMGKETIKWSFNALVFFLVLFVSVQLLNLVLLTKEERAKRKNKTHSTT